MSKARPSANSSPLIKPDQIPKYRTLRFLLLSIGVLSLASGFWTGLARIGIPMPAAPSLPVEFHGALMICGFLGTVISLERAVALRRPWAYAAPLLSAIGAIALLAGASWLAMPAFLLASCVLTAASLAIVLRQRALFTLILGFAAACWGIGTLVWLTRHSMHDAVGWWLAFLVLTIAAERLELSRIVSPPRVSQVMFATFVLLLVVGAARDEFSDAAGPCTGLGLVALAIWLLHYDIARRTVRQSGRTRFSAVCMITGYLWLVISGILFLLLPPSAMTSSYDAAIHAITIGFVLSMIFGHAPIILPAITGWRVGFSAIAYGPLALLHVSLILRILADAFEWHDWRAGSGLVTLIALLSYGVTLLIASNRGALRPA